MIIQTESSILTQCTWCHGTLGKTKYYQITDRLRYAPGHWDLVECKNCLSLVLSPFPTASEVINYYPKIYNIPSPKSTKGIRKLLSGLETKFLAYCYQREAKILNQSLPFFKIDNIKILEIGCGNGNRLEFFNNLKLDITGIDMSEGDIEGIKAKGIKAICGDVQSLNEQFPPNTFDVVMSFDVLEHIPNLDSFFEKSVKILKPGGVMIAGLPSNDCWASRIFGANWIYFTEVPRHVTVPSVEGARKFFSKYGMKQSKIIPYSALSCAVPLAGLVVGAYANKFYSSRFNILTMLKRIAGAVIVFLSAPLFWAENRLTNHPSRFVICATKPTD